MRRLNLLIIKSFIGPFVVTFFVALFVLVMQFLWKYIDDMVGKGLTFGTIAELMMYMSVSLVPLALPLAVLLSSIMTFGNMGEHFELVAAKSAGISLIRVMKPLIIVMVILCAIAFLISNFLMPSATIKANVLLHDVRSAKPTFELKNEAFNISLPDVAIRIGGKEEKGRKVKDIIIYDHRDGHGNNKVITAKTGEFYLTEDKNYVTFDLYDGASYEQVEQQGKGYHPLTLTEFKKQQIIFDVSDFKFERSDESIYKGHYEMLRADELRYYIDSMENVLNQKYDGNWGYLRPYFRINDSAFLKFKPRPLPSGASATQPVNDKPVLQAQILQHAIETARIIKQAVDYSMDDTENYQRSINRYKIEWHRKFTLSFAIMVLFFVGAPFGAIVKKGGLGMPMVISIFLFIVFHILSITGEKFIKEYNSNVVIGMWESSFILLPLGIYLTSIAARDAVIFDKEHYISMFRKIVRFFKKHRKPA
jgi:lipopolysaccharide export system permease protein